MAAILEEVATQRRWVLRPGIDNVVGRVAEVEVHLYDESVTRKHAVVRHDGSAWQVSDLGGTNGTWWTAGGPWERVERHELRSGDLLRIGRVTLRFVEGVDAVEDVSAELRAAELLERLASGDSPGRAGWLVRELDSLGGELSPVLEAAREALCSRSPSFRRVAASVLGGLCRSRRLPSHPIDELLSLTRDPEPSVRASALWELSSAIADPTEPVIRALEDPAEEVFDTAAKVLALSALGPARPWPVDPERLDALAKRAPPGQRGRIEEIAQMYRKRGP